MGKRTGTQMRTVASLPLINNTSNKKETGLSPGLCEFNPSGRDYGWGV